MTTKTVLKARIAAFETEMALLEIKGGAGSGNWGHAGRKGKRGGSAPKGGSHGAAMSLHSGPTAKNRQKAAALGAKPGKVNAKGGDEVVDGYLFDNGNLGVYYNEGVKGWFVVHTKTGLSAGNAMNHPISAMELAKELEKSGIDWSADVNKIMAAGGQTVVGDALKKVNEVDNNRDKEGPEAFDTALKPKKSEPVKKPEPKKQPEPKKKDATPDDNGISRRKVPEVDIDPKKIGTGAPPSGEAVNNDKARKWMANNVSRESYGNNYQEANKDLKKVVNSTMASRGEHKNDIAERLSEKSGLSYDKVNRMVRTWADSSADHDPDSLNMQLVAAKYLGIEPDPYVVKKLSQATGGQNGKGSHTDEERLAFIKAMHQHTQEQLAAAGFKPTDTIRLHRGVTEVFEPKDNVKSGDVVALEQNALTSWSLSMGVAKVFSSGEQVDDFAGGKSGMLTMDVPVSAIIGSCKTGFGCLVEAEVIVADTGKHQAVVQNKYRIPDGYQD